MGELGSKSHAGPDQESLSLIYRSAFHKSYNLRKTLGPKKGGGGVGGEEEEEENYYNPQRVREEEEEEREK